MSTLVEKIKVLTCAFNYHAHIFYFHTGCRSIAAAAMPEGDAPGGPQGLHVRRSCYHSKQQGSCTSPVNEPSTLDASVNLLQKQNRAIEALFEKHHTEASSQLGAMLNARSDSSRRCSVC